MPSLKEAGLRHASYYENTLRQAAVLYTQGGDPIKQGLSLVDSEWRNIQAGRAWLEEHAKHDHVVMKLSISYLVDGAPLFALRQPPQEQIRSGEIALDIARRLKDRHAESVLLGILGSAYMVVNEPRRSVRYCEQALHIVREIGNRRDYGTVLGELGTAYFVLGDYSQAVKYSETYLNIARETGDQAGEGRALSNLGAVYAMLGDLSRVRESWEQALALARETGDWRGESNALSNLALFHKKWGETGLALELYNQSLLISRKIGDRQGEAEVLMKMGNACDDLGQFQRAVKLREPALSYFREVGDRSSEGAVLANLGMSYFAMGDMPRAVACYEQAIVVYREIGAHRLVAFCEHQLAQIRDSTEPEDKAPNDMNIVFPSSREAQRALKLKEQALLLAREVGNQRDEASLHWEMSLIFEQLRDRPQAIAHARSAFELYDQLDDTGNSAKVQQQLGEWGIWVERKQRDRRWWQFWR